MFWPKAPPGGAESGPGPGTGRISGKVSRGMHAQASSRSSGPGVQRGPRNQHLSITRALALLSLESLVHLQSRRSLLTCL